MKRWTLCRPATGGALAHGALAAILVGSAGLLWARQARRVSPARRVRPDLRDLQAPLARRELSARPAPPALRGRAGPPARWLSQPLEHGSRGDRQRPVAAGDAAGARWRPNDRHKLHHSKPPAERPHQRGERAGDNRAGDRLVCPVPLLHSRRTGDRVRDLRSLTETSEGRPRIRHAYDLCPRNYSPIAWYPAST